MNPFLRIAATEVLEQRRQPWMIFILAANYILWMLLFGGLFFLIGRISAAPDTLLRFRTQMAAFGVELDAFVQLAASTFGSLLFTNLPLYVAIMAGTSVLHDRECGTLPFLMLAPITRRQLLAGKLAGAMVIPFAFHLVFVGAAGVLIGPPEALFPAARSAVSSPAWWVAFALGAPASAAFVGALGTVVSALSRDMRTSMQYVSFFVGLLSLGIGFVLVDGVSRGPVFQLAFAAGCVVAAAVTLLAGARLISRDVTS